MHAGINHLEIEANTKQEIVNELITQLTSIKRDQNEQVNLIERELTESEIKTLKTAFLWNEESVREAVSQCKTIKELRERFPSVRGYAKTHGILAEITKTLVRVSERGKYTKEYVSEMASQCQTRKEFRERYKACWSAAQRNGWIAEVCQHMPKHLQKPWLG
jgi:molybdopterin converting factor small subunit